MLWLLQVAGDGTEFDGVDAGFFTYEGEAFTDGGAGAVISFRDFGDVQGFDAVGRKNR